MQPFLIESREAKKDPLGGFYELWDEKQTVLGYLDLSSGSDLRTAQNAITEGSTHMLIVPTFTPGITAEDRVRDPRTGRIYSITYADDPVGIGHHTELYLTYQETEEE